MNIYLDIDGTLLVDIGKAAAGADEFLQAVLAKYPDSAYWLTTHCWRGENRAVQVLAEAGLQSKTVELLQKVKPTDWDAWKTEAIDFGQPFLWFDDDRSPEETDVLAKHGVVGSHIQMDLFANPNQLQDLTRELFG